MPVREFPGVKVRNKGVEWNGEGGILGQYMRSRSQWYS